MVYQAHDPQIDRMVALKVLREDRLTTEDYVQRFLKEATAIGRLSHPGIVTVYDVGQDHGTIYIAMEFLEGQSLDQVLKNGNLTIEDIVTIGIQVSNALEYAHKKGIVHRDIKPPNIIYTPELTTKVTDFGIAHIDDPDGQQMTQAGEILGTPVYMAPEQVMSQAVDGRTDLYSLGVILYELTTGSRPFQGENLAAIFRAITHDMPVPPDQLNPAVPPALSALIMKAMAKKPEDRFDTGQQLAGLLKDCMNGPQHDAFTDTIIQEVPPKKRSTTGLVISLLILLLAAGAGLFMYMQDQETVPEQSSTQKSLPQLPQKQEPALPPAAEEPPPKVSPPAAEVPAPVVIKPDTNKIKTVRPIHGETPTAIPHTSEPPKRVEEIAAEEQTEPKQREDALIEELFTGEQPPLTDTPSEPPPSATAHSQAPTITDEPSSRQTGPQTDSATMELDQPPAFIPRADVTREEVGHDPPPSSEKKTAIVPLVPDSVEHTIDVKTATLAINSQPSGASLYIDGKYRGLTPMELNITAAKHEVKLELQGHLGWQAQLNLSKGGKIPITIPLVKE